jgi:heme exporter protein A
VTALGVEARELSHRYGNRQGLATIDFSLRGPRMVAFTGANGSGKSTLLRILAGLLRPTRGATFVSIGGKDVAPAERRNEIGFASPAIMFYEEMSLAENLTFSAEARGMDHAAAAVQAALERVGLAERAYERVTALSSGMMQRFRLGFALLHAPPLYLLDEPGSHLDAQGRAFVGTLVRDLARTALVLVATNDEREWNLADERIELAGSGLGSLS